MDDEIFKIITNSIEGQTIIRAKNIIEYAEELGVSLSIGEAISLVSESKKIKTLSLALLGEFTPDEIDDTSLLEHTPIHRIANALYESRDIDISNKISIYDLITVIEEHIECLSSSMDDIAKKVHYGNS